jgi:molecular chaperone DnaJ
MPAQSEWLEKDYYKILGVDKKATDKEITRAYRKLAKELHPDRNPGSEERFKEINAAYDVLSDPAKRKEYDEVRRLSSVGSRFGPNGGVRMPGGNFSFRLDDLSDVFGDLLNRSGRTASRQAARRGQDQETELHLSFLDAVRGVTTTVNVVGDVTCHTCGGSGARPGTSPKLCPRCGGTGMVQDNQGLFSLSSPCPVCGGRGQVIEQPCPTCHGTGVERRTRAIKTRIPAGVEDGALIRLKGKGGAGTNGGPPGDLLVHVRVAPHPIFGRKGANLTLNLPVTYAEAVLGAQVSVPTLDKPVTVKIPPGTENGKVLRVKGHGVPGANGKVGDLLVTVNVTVPKSLSKEERAALENFAKVSRESPRERLGVK